ncbi:5-methyltetrahydropteroyltriglutamate--homocysteine methyltransferase [Nakamurella flavida]|uniref:5-methyltetrahydropteroyltriglutamate-- homocysteine S-methyltransferase n=1 Tax=Nakamurella flavida TaxID=363630 RepID=UPI00277E7904|nr:5-methyltetrahydropteroyltriglutamate--homocysteine S-methyltransferase [Nakamurella flavida]MDP9778522.1 5-methyltetrahydropteroyltriglutamate--homocysteine methyltransferase [Nakamurella flavida]
MTVPPIPRTCGATVHGYPRHGPDRELKRAVEAYWAGRADADGLLAVAAQLRRDRLVELRDAGLSEIPGEFSLYDHVADTAWLLGAVPDRHRAAVPGQESAADRLDRYFAMTRGTDAVAPLEMTKWFDTNYHHLVPELGPDTGFALDPSGPLEMLAEARDLGVTTRPVVLGPLTFLLLSKPTADSPADFAPLDLLDTVLPLYEELLARLQAAGASWVQIDEPILVLDQPPAVLDLAARVLDRLTAVPARPKILLAGYFGSFGDALPVLVGSPVDGLALDLVAGTADLAALRELGGLPGRRLVLGVVDGRNVWRTDLDAALAVAAGAGDLAGSLDVAASCSLLHVPLDLTTEQHLDPAVVPWLAFGRQKLAELVVLARGITDGPSAVEAELAAARVALADRRTSGVVVDPAVRARAAAVVDADLVRPPYPERRAAHRRRLPLPLFPTTTIGSFPQTGDLRRARAALRAGQLDPAGYRSAMQAEIAAVLDLQTELGLDVLVHGEPERNDMVQYFAEQLDGFVVTHHGWVQSYGTRCVRPPILVGDVSRPVPMTVPWTTWAQARTDRPVKGMLTGPVTMLAWSFVRDDLPIADTARQVALALRDEVVDLDAAGTAIIQVDEPALRETLPLRRADRAAYLDWATRAFRLATSGVATDTAVHTHMCYAEFGDILSAVFDLDADVISVEAARSGMGIGAELADAGYPHEVGPGVWDIHSPRVPSVDEMEAHLRATSTVLPAERLWVNPDCGLKTRGRAETVAALGNLVAAALRVRVGR